MNYKIDGFISTEEQTPIIRAIIDGTPRMLVNAFAGSGKTATLLGIAENLPSSFKILYIVFNTAMSAEAKRRFPVNVETKTINAFARRYALGDRKLRKNNYSATEIRNMFDLSYKEAVSALNQFERYCNSSLLEVPLNWSFSEIVIEIFEAMKNGDMDATHSWYLKKFHLLLAERGRPYDLPQYDIIMLDEYQDTNGVTKAIVNSLSPKQYIRVGDQHQGIYGFRGAENTMLEDISSGGDDVFYLTSSFRFNQNIANHATTLLSRFLGETQTIKGLGKKKKIRTACFISRTNASLITGIEHYVSKGDKFKTLREPSLIFGLPIALAQLNAGYEDRLEKRFKYLLWEYKNFRYSGGKDFIAHCLDSAEENNDKELYASAKIADDFSLTKLETLLEKASDYFKLSEDVHYHFGTAHSVKGLEFDYVYLVDDFRDYIAIMAKSLYECNIRIHNGNYLDAFRKAVLSHSVDYSTIEEFNLIYVAITRASVKVVIPDGIKFLIEGDEKLINQHLFSAYQKLKRKDN